MILPRKTRFMGRREYPCSLQHTLPCAHIYIRKRVHNIDVVHYSLPIIMLRGAWQGVVVYEFLYEGKNSVPRNNHHP
jgi:hypothetical protein